MKTVLKGILNASILALLLSLIYCCDDDDEGKGMAGFRKFKGEVVVSPSFTQIGDTVTFDIYRSFDWIHEVNGKIPVLTVSYYLDGVKVAEATSEDEAAPEDEAAEDTPDPADAAAEAPVPEPEAEAETAPETEPGTAPETDDPFADAAALSAAPDK